MEEKIIVDEKMLNELLNFNNMPKIDGKKPVPKPKKPNKVAVNAGRLGEFDVVKDFWEEAKPKQVKFDVGEGGLKIMKEVMEQEIAQQIHKGNIQIAEQLPPVNNPFDELLDDFEEEKLKDEGHLMWGNKKKIGKLVGNQEIPPKGRGARAVGGINGVDNFVLGDGPIHEKHFRHNVVYGPQPHDIGVEQFCPDKKLEDRVIVSLDHTASVLAMNAFNERAGMESIKLVDGVVTFADEFEDEFTFFYDKFYDILMTMKKG